MPERPPFGLRAAAAWRKHRVNALCDNRFEWYHTYLRPQLIRLVAGINKSKSIELEVGQRNADRRSEGWCIRWFGLRGAFFAVGAVLAALTVGALIQGMRARDRRLTQ
jgi:hypothetical protein